MMELPPLPPPTCGAAIVPQGILMSTHVVWTTYGPSDMRAYATAAIAAAVAEEREACAKVCDAGVNNATDWDSSAWDQACENRALAIRTRTEGMTK